MKKQPKRTYESAMADLAEKDPAFAASIERIKTVTAALNNGVRDAVLRLAYELNIDPEFAFQLAAGHLEEWVKGTYQQRMRQVGLTTEGQ